MHNIKLLISLLLLLTACGCTQPSHDSQQQAKEYITQGVRLYKEEMADSALLNFKKAEQIATELHDDSLLFAVRSNLAKVNARAGNYPLAMHYATQIYHDAMHGTDLSRRATACNIMAVIYDMRGDTARAFGYIKQLKQYAGYGTPYDKAYFATNLGVYYMRKHQDGKALAYLSQAFSIMPVADAYCALAVIYGRRGHFSAADSLYRKALQTPDLYYKITFLSALATQYGEMGKFKEAFDLSQRIMPLKDTLTMRQQTARIQALQLRFDQQLMRHKMERNMLIAVAVIFFLLIIGVWYVLHTRMKQQRMSELISNSQSLVDSYTRQIETLKQHGQEAAQQTKELRRRITSLQKKQAAILAKGHEHYNSILAGGRTTLWKKEDFENFIEYYKVIDLQYVLHLETEYNNLSHTNKFFMILLHMGMSEEEVQQAMGLSNGAFRTIKYRIKKKQLEPSHE